MRVGTFRLLLAVIVMLGHLSFYPQPIPYFMPGGIAVEAFYIVSGFLITLVLVEKYQDRLLLFYSNRALRIYPIYWTCLLLYLLVNALVVYGFVSTTSNLPSTSALWWAQNHQIDGATKAATVLLNIFIVGQDIVRSGFGNPTNSFLHNFVYVRVAWSVAVELCFYAIAPFVVRRLWLTGVLLTSSFMAQTWGVHTQFEIRPFDFSAFPFPLWCFMCGVFAYHAYAKLRTAKPRWLTSYSLAATATLISLTMMYNSFGPPRLFYLFAVTICLPGLVLFGRRNPLDSAMGELSYPLYLIHPLATIIIITGSWGEYVSVLLILGLSWGVAQFVERPIDRYRQYRARRQDDALHHPMSLSPL